MHKYKYIFEFWKIENNLNSLPLQNNSNKSHKLPLTEEYNDIFYVHNKQLLTKYSQIQSSLKSVHIYASLVPDMLLNCDSNLHPKINPCVAVLMYVDISGFTPLSEKCAESGSDGVFKLTSIVNEFFSKMVALIYELGGDVWKFSGDAFLAIWKIEMADHIGLITHKALFCALHIQKNLGCYSTEFGITLQVKIGMSVGNAIWTMVGDQTSRRSVMVGTPVLEVKDAEKLCGSGEVVVSAAVWTQISPNDCVHQVLNNGLFIKVIRLLGCLGLQSPRLLNRVGVPNRHIEIANSHSFVRDFSKLRTKEEVCSTLRSCIMPIVAQQIDADLNLKYINELRSLTLMFINIIPNSKLLDTELICAVDKAFNVINSLVQKAGGFMEKVSMFDKDIVFLTVFGLRGFCDNQLISACLHSGYDIREACLPIEGIKTISVGITTGLAYCGVVGHPLRREITVMGPAVNKAARIMVEFPNAVTCDETTYTAAKLPPAFFYKHHQRRLRGFSSEDCSYKFVADKMSILHSLITNGMPPLLGRKKEMALFRSTFKNMNCQGEKPKAICIVGEEKCGKSRFFDEIIKELYQMNVTPIVAGLRIGHSILPYGSAIYILRQALKLSEEMELKELKNKLRILLKNDLTESELSDIDDLFDYKTSCNHNEIIVSNIQKRIFVLSFLRGMDYKVLSVDDVHLCDFASWQLIVALIESHLILVILTNCNGNNFSPLPKMGALISLGPLDSNDIAPLACQILQAQAIELQVIRFLESRCNGRPGLCKTYLEALVKNKHIIMKQIGRSSLDDSNIEMPLTDLLICSAFHVEPLNVASTALNQCSEEMDSEEYNYRNLKSTISVMTHQKWWITVQKSFIKISDNRKASIQQEEFGSTIKPVSPDVVPNFCTMKGSKQWPGLVRNMFITESLKSLILEEDVCFNATYDKSLINESISIFNRAKNVKPRIEVGQNDMMLDTLKIQKNMQKFPELRESRKMLNNESEDVDSTEQIVNLRSNSRAADNILDRLSEQDNIVCIAKSADLDLDEVKLESNVNFLSIFDNLKPFEQLVLKCAAIIGVHFARPTLDAILHYPESSLTSLAIMRLIDLNILWCTKTFKLKINKKCACQHLLPDLSLPYYAFCMNLGFRYPGFKNVLYNILPPNQKGMFHKRAVECLSAERVICLSCSTQESQAFDETRRRSSTPRSLSFTTQQRSVLFSKLSQALLNVRWRNMTECTCYLVEIKRLDSIIHQCDAADLYGETIKFKIKYAKSCIRNKKISDAEGIAKLLLTNIKVNAQPLSVEEKKTFIAEAQILLGEVNIENGKLDVAFAHLLKAVVKLVPFNVHIAPWSFLHIYLPIFSKIWLHLKQESYADIAAKALMLIAKILMIKKSYKDAHMVNSASLKILRKMNNLINLCRAYGNQVDIIISLEESLDDVSTEQEMLSLASKMLPTHSIYSALALGRLIHAIYIRRTMGAGDLGVGLNFLQSMINLTQSIPATCSRELLAVESVLVLTMMGRIKEAVAQIMHIRIGGKPQQLWYHVLCLDFFRITGYWIEDPEESIHFIEKALKKEVDGTVLYTRAVLTLQMWLLWTNPRAVSCPISLPNHPQPVRNITDCMSRVEELMALVLQANVPAAVLWWSKISRILRTWITEVGIMSYKCRVMLPSYLHFRAYIFYRMENSLPRAEQMLTEAMKIARQQGNELMTARIALTGETFRLPDTSYSASPPFSKGKKWTEWQKDDWVNTLIRLP